MRVAPASVYSPLVTRRWLAARAGVGRRQAARLGVLLLLWVLAVAACMAALGCAGSELVLPPDAAPPAPAVDAAMPPDAAPPFTPDIGSLRLKRSIAVRVAPAEDAARHGTVARDVRVAWQRVIQGEGCSKRWIEIEPYGWICERYVAPSANPPLGIEVPRLRRGEIVPGAYGQVVTEGAWTFVLRDEELVVHRQLGGSVKVRRYGEYTAPAPVPASGADALEGAAAVDSEAGTGDQAGTETAIDRVRAAARDEAAGGSDPTGEQVDFWLIDKQNREYLPREHVRELRPSEFHGVRLGDDTGLDLPLGFPMARRRPGARVPVYSEPRAGRVVRRIASRVPVPVRASIADDKGEPAAYRIGDGQWVRASDMRVAVATEPPHLTGPLERWMDIDLDQQVLVAYEGTLPVYATLVTTGSRKFPTETGIYRTWIKFAEIDMSDLAAESPYSVATVPWTQFYAKDLALHTAYWHDHFGTRRSHGCTNLAPIDARFLYFWSDPQVPPGWSMAHSTPERPGSQIRVRSQADPSPAMRGDALRVYESRLAGQGRQASSGL